MPTLEEYSALLCIELINPDKICYKQPNKFWYPKKLTQIMGVNVEAVDQRTKQKGMNDYIPWNFLRDYILEHSGENRARNVFVLVIYGMIILPKHLWCQGELYYIVARIGYGSHC